MQGSYELDATVGWHWSTRLSLADCQRACEDCRKGSEHRECIPVPQDLADWPCRFISWGGPALDPVPSAEMQILGGRQNPPGIHGAMVLRPPPLQLHDAGAHLPDHGRLAMVQSEPIFCAETDALISCSTTRWTKMQIRS